MKRGPEFDDPHDRRLFATPISHLSKKELRKVADQFRSVVTTVGGRTIRKWTTTESPLEKRVHVAVYRMEGNALEFVRDEEQIHQATGVALVMGYHDKRGDFQALIKRQERYHVGLYLEGVPTGRLQSGKTVLESIADEAQAETGFFVDPQDEEKIVHIGDAYLDPRRSPDKGSIWLVFVDPQKPASQRNLERHESLVDRGAFMPLGEINREIRFEDTVSGYVYHLAEMELNAMEKGIVEPKRRGLLYLDIEDSLVDRPPNLPPDLYRGQKSTP